MTVIYITTGFVIQASQWWVLMTYHSTMLSRHQLLAPECRWLLRVVRLLKHKSLGSLRLVGAASNMHIIKLHHLPSQNVLPFVQTTIGMAACQLGVGGARTETARLHCKAITVSLSCRPFLSPCSQAQGRGCQAGAQGSSCQACGQAPCTQAGTCIRK